MALTVTPASAYDGRVGEAYSHQMAASGGTAPYTYSISAGSLPLGLSLNTSAGLISGTPTSAALYSFTVQATDSAGSPDTGTRAYSNVEITVGDQLTNSLVDGACTGVAAPYGPLTRITDVEDLPIPNLYHKLEFKSVAGTPVWATYQQLIDTDAIQRQIALAAGRDYIMNSIKGQVSALKTYFDGIAESDGEGYTQAEYEHVLNALREIHQISGFFEKVSGNVFWS